FYHFYHLFLSFFFFSSRRRHTRSTRDWSSDVCSSDLRNQLKASFQINDFHLRPNHQFFPVFAFQRRAGQHHILALCDPLQNRIPDRSQPRRPVRITQRNSLPDFFYVLRRMKTVGIHEFPVKLLRQEAADRRLPCPGNSHYQNDHLAPASRRLTRHPCASPTSIAESFIFFPELIPGILHREPSVRLCCDVNVIPVLTARVRDELFAGVVLFPRIFRIMQLPQVL